MQETTHVYYDGSGNLMGQTDPKNSKWDKTVRSYNLYDLPDGHPLKEQYREYLSDDTENT